MFTDLKPRMMMTRAEGNILITQIRAEKKRYQCRQEPIFLNSHRDQNRAGKRVFKQHLYQTTALFLDSRPQRSRSQSPLVSASKAQRGKRQVYQNPISSARQLSQGKRKVLQERRGDDSHNIIGFSPQKLETSPSRFSKKRLDLSPNNQNRLSPGFHLFRANQK